MITRYIRKRPTTSRLIAGFAIAQLVPWMVIAAEPTADDATDIKVASASAQRHPVSVPGIVEDETVESTFENCRPIRRLGGKIRIRRHDCAN